MRTYEDLNAMDTNTLEYIKKAELERISSNESYRQRLISSILSLQNIETNVDMRRQKQ